MKISGRNSVMAPADEFTLHYSGIKLSLLSCLLFDFLNNTKEDVMFMMYLIIRGHDSFVSCVVHSCQRGGGDLVSLFVNH